MKGRYLIRTNVITRPPTTPKASAKSGVGIRVDPGVIPARSSKEDRREGEPEKGGVPGYTHKWMRSIVVGIDFSENSERALALAADVARSFEGRLWLVHVAAPNPEFVGYEVGPQTVRDARAAELREEHRELQRRAERLREGGLDATALLIEGSTVEALLAQAAELEADLLVVGSHGRGVLGRALIGSVSEGVTRRSERPILIVPVPK